VEVIGSRFMFLIASMYRLSFRSRCRGFRRFIDKVPLQATFLTVWLYPQGYVCYDWLSATTTSYDHRH